MKSPELLTTGRVAKICGVAAQTVNRWFDAGDLKGHRLPTSGRDRRIHRDDLVAFMVKQGWPSAMIPKVVGGSLLIVGSRPHDGFAASGYEVVHVATAFDAGGAFMDRPAAVLVNMEMGRIDAGIIAARVARSDTPCIALTEQFLVELADPNFCAAVSPKLSTAEMAIAIQECVRVHEAAKAAERRAS